MKLAAIALAALASLVDARVADACEPETTCGDQFCWGALAVADATILSMPTTENYRTSILVHVTNAWGMTDGVQIGGNATLKTTMTFSDQDIGKSYVLYLERNDEGNLSIERAVDLADYWTTMCLGADATPESLATVVLAPDCYHTLTPVEPPPPHCPTGIGCDAGGARGGAPFALALAGLVIRRRRRRA
jgi:uncharacterized protein (TIGR03382 family)